MTRRHARRIQRRKFRRTANKTKKINITGRSNWRNGIRL